MTTVTISLTDEQINSLQKAPYYLEHYGSYELNEHLQQIWMAIAKAALSNINPQTP